MRSRVTQHILPVVLVLSFLLLFPILAGSQPAQPKDSQHLIGLNDSFITSDIPERLQGLEITGKEAVIDTEASGKSQESLDSQQAADGKSSATQSHVPVFESGLVWNVPEHHAYPSQKCMNL